MNWEELQREIQKLEDIFSSGFITQGEYNKRKRELEFQCEICEDSPSYDEKTVNQHKQNNLNNKNNDIYYNENNDRWGNENLFGVNNHQDSKQDKKKDDKKKENEKYTPNIEREEVEIGKAMREYYVDRERQGVVIYQKNMYGNVQTLPFSDESTLSEVLQKFGMGNGFLIKLDLSEWEKPPELETHENAWNSDDVKIPQQKIFDQLNDPLPAGHYVIVQKRSIVHRGWICSPNRDISVHKFSRPLTYTSYFNQMISDSRKATESDYYPKTKYQLPRAPSYGAQVLCKEDKKDPFLWFCLRMRILEDKHGKAGHAVRLLHEILKCQEKKMCYVCKDNLVSPNSLFCDSHVDQAADQLFREVIKKLPQWHSLPKEKESEDDGVNRRTEKYLLVEPTNAEFLKKMKKLGHVSEQ